MSETFTGWRTPRGLFDLLDRSVRFAVDAAADEGNHLCEQWYGSGGIQEDALLIPQWASPAWCNPPYGKGIEKWLEKFIEQGEMGVQVVALLPARVETRWWADLVVPHADIIFLTGRVPFERPCEVCKTTTATLKGNVLTKHGAWDRIMCAECCGKFEDVSDIKTYHTQPDHASALVFYGGLGHGRVSWVDWRGKLSAQQTL